MFKNKWVVLSGASSGIGEAIAKRLLNTDARLVLIGRNREKLQNFKDTFGVRVKIVELDLAKVDTIRSKLLPTLESIGSVYGLCHAAGLVTTKPISSTSPDILQNIMNVNVYAAFELTRAVVHRQIMDSDGGSLVWVASVYATLGSPGQSAYAASKGALVPAIKSLALELAPRKIKANVISPGFVQTSMTASLSDKQRQYVIEKHPLGEGSVKDVARAAEFLLSTENQWITGTNLIVDGGYGAR